LLVYLIDYFHILPEECFVLTGVFALASVMILMTDFIAVRSSQVRR
jgi:hypothetical protein